MTNKERDQQFEVVFDGTQELLPDRDTLPSGLWAGNGPVKRLYNKTGKHTKNPDFWDRYDKEDPCEFNFELTPVCSRGTKGCPKDHNDAEAL